MKIYLLLIPILILSGCTIDWSDEKDKKIAELEKQVTELKVKNDDDLFKKNTECSKKDLWDLSILNNHEVFYSPKNNTCIAVGTLVENENTPEEMVTWGVVDLLTNENILILSYKTDKVTQFTHYNTQDLLKLTVNEAKCIFNKEVAKLKQRDSWSYFQSAENCN